MKRSRRPLATVPDPCCAPAAGGARSAEDLRTDDALPALRAMADPTRLGLLRLLMGSDGPVCVCDLTAAFSVGQPTISHHLKVLREAGLVEVSRRGTWAYYAPREEGLAAVRALLR